MQKLTNRDIEWIVKQWKKGKQISEIANYFGVSWQWVHHLLNRYKQSGMIPVLHKSGRKPKGIAEETRFLHTVLLMIEELQDISRKDIPLGGKIQERPCRHTRCRD